MRIFDLTRLAVKSMKGRWSALSFLGMAVSAFCLCFAGAIVTTVQDEKAQPYELIVSAMGSADIGESAVAELLKIPDVKAATPILQAPVTIKTGNYAAQLTLTGLDAGYFDGIFAQGGIFPAASVMPYILLNEAACKQFAEVSADAKSIDAQVGSDDQTVSSNTNTDRNTGSNADMPKIDWLNVSFSVVIGEDGRGITSKVCGILSENDTLDAPPAAYISLAVAKDLLRKSSQPGDAKTAWVRIANIGCAEAVSRQIDALGLDVTNANVQKQAEWDAKMKEMVYLMVVAAFCLSCAALLLAANRAIALEQQKSAFDLLRWMGMKDRTLSRMFVLYALMVALTGSVIGIAIAVSLPSFLPSEIKGTSSYTLPIPFWIAAGSLALCTLAGAIPACFAKMRQP
jgi:ABC-type lipoprotein release transport system permease subunit